MLAKASLTADEFRKMIERRRADAERRAVRTATLIEWQKTEIDFMRKAGRKDLATAEEVLASLVECRAWYAEMATQADRDLRFADRH